MVQMRDDETESFTDSRSQIAKRAAEILNYNPSYREITYLFSAGRVLRVVAAFEKAALELGLR